MSESPPIGSRAEHVEHTEHTEHVETALPAEEAAEHVVEVAQTAVALANETAAAAEQDAAERVRLYIEESQGWRNETGAALSALGESLARNSGEISSLREREEERHRQDSALSARLAELEARLRPSIPEPSTEATEATEAPEVEPGLIGAEGAVNLGPAEATAGASLGASSERKRRRWT